MCTYRLRQAAGDTVDAIQFLIELRAREGDSRCLHFSESFRNRCTVHETPQRKR